MLQYFSNFFPFWFGCQFYGLTKVKSRRNAPYVRLMAVFLMVVASASVSGQVVYSVSTRVSSIIGTSAFFRGEVNGTGIPVKEAQIYALRIGKRLCEDKYWHYGYNYPEVGFGIEYLDIANDSEIGNPVSAYMYVEAGLVDRKSWRLTLATDFGLSYGWKPYNTLTNVNNVALGSRLNYHVGLGFRSTIYLHQRLALLVAPMLNHHSNGAVTKPNLGVNMVSIELGLKYWPTTRQRRTEWTTKKRSIGPYSDLSFFMGTRNVEIDGPYYQFYGLHVNRVFPLSSLFAYGVGTEVIYDRASFAGGASVRETRRLSSAVYAMAGVHLDRLSLSLDIGRYLYRADGDRLPTSQYYQRMSLRYRVTDTWFLTAKVRAFELRKADLLEFHIGYVL